MRRLSRVVFLLLACVTTLPRVASAVLIDALDPARQWRVMRIEFSGNQKFPDDELTAAIVTTERPWYRFWGDRPAFDPITFTTDLERLRRFYESRGYYRAVITYDLDVDQERGLITARFRIREGEPVRISEIDVAVAVDKPDQKPPPLPDELPVKRGDVFRETEYQQGEQSLRSSLADIGYAHVQTQRKAEVDVDELQAEIQYGVRPGPVTFFGETEVKGLDAVVPEVILRELTYRPGEIYSLKKVAESREKILALDLFGTVRVAPAETQGAPVILPMVVEVTEKPHREVRLSLGYGTEDLLRSQLEWRDLNFFGGARRLSITAKYSSIAQSGALTFIQPHFLTDQTRGSIKLNHDQEEEETYVRKVTQLTPRVDHRFSRELTGFLGFRSEYDDLNKVSNATEQALGVIRQFGFLIGPTAGLVWNTSDDVFNPKKGHVLALTVDQAGAIWGGQYDFFKVTGEAKNYIEIGWNTVFASRLKLGLADSIGPAKNYPIFERFFAGGEKSVRGYGRRRLGPLNDADEPLGGLSLVEGSFELRRPIWNELNGAVFLDFGQVSRRAFDPPFGDLRFSSGFGVSYSTPVGPLRFDVGFPFKRPRSDNPWQIHFSIGAYF
ncbi:MAG TPA: outer membrane protein assembly factor BamA [Candidatus Binatia bacterium]|nr:outer membrane protein assembly factor BamA [Candidatus Binatia bacterium]